MIKWIKENNQSLIRFSFLFPIILVAAISISHVISWYDLANPYSWAVYLSIAIEIAALAAISAASVQATSAFVWLVFSIVTFVQFVGNIYFSYTEIDVTQPSFKQWIELVLPLSEAIGLDSSNLVAQRRLLALLEGGLLPIISLTCLHFFIKYKPSEIIAEEQPKILNNLVAQQIDNIEVESQDLPSKEVEVGESKESQPPNVSEQKVKGRGLSLKMKKILNLRD